MRAKRSGLFLHKQTFSPSSVPFFVVLHSSFLSYLFRFTGRRSVFEHYVDSKSPLYSHSTYATSPVGVMFRVTKGVVARGVDGPLCVGATNGSVEYRGRLHPYLFGLAGGLIPLALTRVSVGFVSGGVHFLLRASHRFVNAFADVTRGSDRVKVRLFRVAGRRKGFVYFCYFVGALLRHQDCYLFHRIHRRH